MTSDEMVTAIRRRWGETDNNNSSIQDPELLDYMNEAQSTLCLLGNILLQCAKVNLVASQETYNLPSNYLKAEAVFHIGTLNGPKRKLTPISVIDRDPEGRTGQLCTYYIWGSNVNGVNEYVLGLTGGVPAQSESNAVEVFYRRRAAIMALASPGPAVNPEVIVPFQYACVDYALMRVYQRLGISWFGHYQFSKAAWEKWEHEAKVYVNPLQFDVPIPSRDTWGYGSDYYDGIGY